MTSGRKTENALIVQLGREGRVHPPPLPLRLAIDTAQRLFEWVR
jgi:hypothetical protein